MTINKNDYVEGYEHFGSTVKKTRGWVNSVSADGEHIYYDLQADDSWNGHRGTLLYSELGKVEKLEDKPRPETN